MDPVYSFRTDKRISEFSDRVKRQKLNLTYRQRKRFSAPVLRTFFKIADFWKLTAKEKMYLLGIKSYRALGCRMSAKVILTSNELAQIGLIFWIYKDLYVLFSGNEDSRRNWMKKPNDAPMFGGKSAMEWIMDSDMPFERILSVRNYLGYRAH